MIHLAKPTLEGKEWEYVKESLDTNWISAKGKFIERFENQLKEATGSKFVIATSSGTAALHLALKVIGIQPEDLVILPDLSFVAAANTIQYLNAEPIFIDIYPNNWQMDLDLLEDFLRNQTIQKEGLTLYKKTQKVIRAILAIHNLGNIGDMQRLQNLAQKYNLKLVEDAAEALGSTYQGKSAGTFGDVATLSFNGNKVVTSGGGGMVLTNNEKIAKKIKHWTYQSKVGEEYWHDEVGYNYAIPNILAAIGVAQMEQMPQFLEKRKQIFQAYQTRLKHIPNLEFMKIDSDVTYNHWLTTILHPKAKEIKAHLAKNQIQTRSLWTPLHQLPFLKGYLFITQNHISDQIFERSLSLPSFSHLMEKEIQKITDLIQQILQ